MIRAIERATGDEFKAKKIEGGFEVYTLAGEKYKKLKDSTFKRYFKVTGDMVTEEKSQEATQEEPKTEEKTTKKEKSSKKQKEAPKTEEPKVELDDVTRANLIDKIKKILNLGKDNPSVEEGTSAILKAQKLMAKYNIHEDEVTLEEVKDEITEDIVNLKHDSHLHSWYKHLAVTVAKNFRVKTYLDGRKDIVFRGYTDDTKIATEVYRYLYTLGARLAHQACVEARKETGGSAKGVYNSFVMGYLEGIEEALNEQCTALMIIIPKEVEEEYAKFSKSFETKKVTVRGKKNQTYEDGKVEGKNAVKSRQLTDKKNKKGKEVA